jgi:hypothetical protein
LSRPWSQSRWPILSDKQLTIFTFIGVLKIPFKYHLMASNYLISIALTSNMIIKALVSGYKFVKLVNGNYCGSKSGCGWTRRSEVSTSSRTRLLNVDSWECWIGSSGKWANENSQSSGFYEAMLSTIKIKSKQSKPVMTWSNPRGKATINLYMFFNNRFKKLVFSNIASMTLPWWYLIK